MTVFMCRWGCFFSGWLLLLLASCSVLQTGSSAAQGQRYRLMLVLPDGDGQGRLNEVLGEGPLQALTVEPLFKPGFPGEAPGQVVLELRLPEAARQGLLERLQGAGILVRSCQPVP